MPQNTNSIAFLNTKPIASNVGKIIEEHIRYWTKYYDDQEAQRKKEEALQKEFERKKSKGVFDLYSGLADADVNGYFLEQINRYKESKSDYWLELSKGVWAGDDVATQKYMMEKDRLESLINASTEKLRDLQPSFRQGNR